MMRLCHQNVQTASNPSVCTANIESVLSYSPREELVVSLADAQTASHILPPDEEFASICKSNHQT